MKILIPSLIVNNLTNLIETIGFTRSPLISLYLSILRIHKITKTVIVFIYYTKDRTVYYYFLTKRCRANSMIKLATTKLLNNKIKNAIVLL